MDTSASLLPLVFNHIALPPQLPGSHDSNIEEVGKDICARLLNANRHLTGLKSDILVQASHHVHQSLEICMLVNDVGRLNKSALLESMRDLKRGEVLILHITEQNAGLLIRRQVDNQGERVVFEAFEASPISETVLESKNALQWDFPGSACAIPFPDYIDPSFQESLATFLEQASAESIKLFSARARKAGRSVVEVRDTVDPAIVTQMLMTLLEAKGCRVFPTVLRKRVRDDVCWNDAYLPWRRCPYWLVLRVAIQRQLYLLSGGEIGRAHYKFLICLVLTDLLRDSLGTLNPESLAFLKSKLCRRLAKLETDRLTAPPTIRNLYNELFAEVGPYFRQVIQGTIDNIESEWSTFKKSNFRPIPPLPRRANTRDLYLTLPHSGRHLRSILDQPLQRRQDNSRFSLASRNPLRHDAARAAAERFRSFTEKYSSLAEAELNALSSNSAGPNSPKKAGSRCISLAHTITKYLSDASGAYESNPEQKSIMILTVMDLWVSMDRRAIEVYPLLKDFDPGFPPSVLDVLQLSDYQDMCRLLEIQLYLQTRLKGCRSPRKTIFIDPAKGCFAERYFDDSKYSPGLQELRAKIEAAAGAARREKERELTRISEKYDHLTQEIGRLVCPFGTHDRKSCQKCCNKRARKHLVKVGIQILEHPLPREEAELKAVLFEISVPEAFAEYRDVTWSILRTLGHPEHAQSRLPEMSLPAYTPLKKYRTSTKSKISLASTTKSFLVAHYSKVRLPASISDVCVPLGLKFSYFDTSSNLWLSEQPEMPTFAQHCNFTLPKNTPWQVIQQLPDFTPDKNGPSSYEVIARQTQCPSELNVHEFMAYQALFSGKSRRWPTMLMELGSPTLNFSSEATMLLFCQLASQVGPAHESDPLRVAYMVFRDESFCNRMLEQVSIRLDNISANWRECYCMEMLLTLSLRLRTLQSGNIMDEATRVLDKIRTITLRWIGLLRKEIREAAGLEIARTNSRYALWAALLCRRTFSTYTDTHDSLDLAALRGFVECSIALQENLIDDLAQLPLSLRNAMIRDTKMVHRMRSLLLKSFKFNLSCLPSAISNAWPEPEGTPARSYSEWTFLSPPYGWWIFSTVSAMEFTSSQTVHYHLLEGHLLVDGQPLGKLPAEYQNANILKELFGDQHLLTFPSSLPGMTYMVPTLIEGHQIHFGFRAGKLIIRARIGGTLLECVEREIFGDHSNLDLPAPLVDGCVHWLDIKNKELQIRRQPKIWRKRPSNWTLDLKTRQAFKKNVYLVNPHSALFRQVAQIFEHFEHRSQLVVYQPRGSLSVELKRLELRFSVNSQRLLQSPQLRSEIDPNQDAGTLYGLKSMIVLRDCINRALRSVIIPTGLLRHNRDGIHVAIFQEITGVYGRFTIDDVLGRLQCPAEPLLLYLKAQLHAYTSSIVSDPLTGRTGAEEALHSLNLGLYQPWMPLIPRHHDILLSIATLTPKRVYYPRHLKRQQTVSWDAKLPYTTQHDGYRPAVEAILHKSQQLSSLMQQVTGLSSENSTGEPHLLERSYSRRHIYERPNSISDKYELPSDLPYIARDRLREDAQNTSVYDIVHLIQSWPRALRSTLDLSGILQKWQNIGGFNTFFEKASLTEQLTVDLPLEWGALANLCRRSGIEDRNRLTFLFAVIAFRDNLDEDILQTLVAFAVLENLKSIEPPLYSDHERFKKDEAPTLGSLLNEVKNHFTPFPESSQHGSTYFLSLERRLEIESARTRHENRCLEVGRDFVQFLLNQWPCWKPSMTGFYSVGLIDIDRAMTRLLPEWQRLFKNMQLSRYIEKAQRVLNLHFFRYSAGWRMSKFHSQDTQDVFPTRPRHGDRPTLSQDLCPKIGPTFNYWQRQYWSKDNYLYTVKALPNNSSPSQHSPGENTKQELLELDGTPEAHELQNIVSSMMDCGNGVRKQYGHDLMQSLNALKILQSAPQQREIMTSESKLAPELEKAQMIVRAQFRALQRAFESDSRFYWLQSGNLWPCITPITLLQQLRSTSNTSFGIRMKESLISYGIAITSLQRLLRMVDSYRKGNQQKLREEQRNRGHSNWQPSKFPDWLLLEIEANILIRSDQVDVALATISPASGANSVLQMNMGQGKTSCIIPMVAAVLSDSVTLARVIVPKALLLQTAQLLQSRLGGLIGREVRHIPFSRRTPTTLSSLKSYEDIHSQVLESAGIILALPETILSFKLSGLQRLLDKQLSEAKKMVELQTWLTKVCHDILDECDVTLAVRTQLIYPSGAQLTVDGHPHRWQTAQALLDLAESHLWNLKEEFPQSVDVIRKSNSGFPIVHFLRQDVEDALIRRLVDDVCDGRTVALPTVAQCSQMDRAVIRKFISDAEVLPQHVQRIHQLFPDKIAMRQNLFLLRGLLVHRILLLCLKKRWNVQYGLHPNRDPIAVPFHAKGTPSEQAEWGHPDVAILFTCLAFYYTGLTSPQLRQALQQVLQSDDPSSEYDRWLHSSESIPNSLREWNHINVDDKGQMTELHQHLRLSVVVINYYLNSFVFPRHAKQFSVKLQASGWDIPSFSSASGRSNTEVAVRTNSRSPKPLTTGFSGTNDNRRMLPLNITQNDLPGLSHTNAEVLTYLLQGRNRGYVLVADSRGKHLSELDLLNGLCKMGIRVLIDAGAHILESENHALAASWLGVDHDADAAVYFDNSSKAWVLYRNGLRIPLLASPFADNLEGCLVYLDEAHTRGTDLKMPARAHGALTLGLGQTKDHMVQAYILAAAMRLRQLGASQRISFFAAPEVHQSILDFRKKKMGDQLDSADVIYWLLEQTCRGIEQLLPLYFSQALGFCQRAQAGLDHPSFLTNTTQRAKYLDVLRQRELHSLEKLYSPARDPLLVEAASPLSPKLQKFMDEIGTRRNGFQDAGHVPINSEFEEVEQEREVAFEVEAVRQVQRPFHYSPLSFTGPNNDIISFARTGILRVGSSAWIPALKALSGTALGRKHGINVDASSARLYVSKEFTRTIDVSASGPNDNFLRPVNWILWCPSPPAALIVIPEEAELLITILRDNSKPATHLLTYAAPVTRKMLHFNDLTYFSIPPLPAGWKAPNWLKIELGIFAGRLYLEFDEYADLKKYLGISGSDATSTSITEVEEREYSLAGRWEMRHALKLASGVSSALHKSRESFTAKPLTFLHEWLALRRRCEDFTHTPMGYVCQGKELKANHPFFVSKAQVETQVNHGETTWTAGSLDADLEMSSDMGTDSDIDDLEDREANLEPQKEIELEYENGLDEGDDVSSLYGI
ncbi:hypothetical protein AOQ84DRAFT_417852 [Glonium stellatum]|uniref:ubiquitinyl hydrolase 1 n=1 Tax=Glonium stellatum TaxID=574774 RepID=A0A8E2FA67_9PEZI|nr:hypothetical protein AOQ84DRAFT_417852 [Glonium stellatum]